MLIIHHLTFHMVCFHKLFKTPMLISLVLLSFSSSIISPFFLTPNISQPRQLTQCSTPTCSSNFFIHDIKLKKMPYEKKKCNWISSESVYQKSKREKESEREIMPTLECEWGTLQYANSYSETGLHKPTHNLKPTLQTTVIHVKPQNLWLCSVDFEIWSIVCLLSYMYQKKTCSSKHGQS